MSKQTRVRSRERTIDLADTENPDSDKLEKLIVSVYRANLANNEAEKAYKKARAELLGLMKDKKLKRKLVEYTDAKGCIVTLIAGVEAPESDKADIKKLYKIVGMETFMKIVSATKTAIVDIAGAAVFEQVKTTVIGAENVSVKPLKQ